MRCVRHAAEHMTLGMGNRHGGDAYYRDLGMTFALDIVAPARGVAGRVVGRSGYRRRSVYARWIRLLRVRVRPDGPYALGARF